MKNYFDLFKKNNETILDDLYSAALKTHIDINKYGFWIDKENIQYRFKLNTEKLKNSKISISVKLDERKEGKEIKDNVYLIYKLISGNKCIELHYHSLFQKECCLESIFLHDKKKNKVLVLKEHSISIVVLDKKHNETKVKLVIKDSNNYGFESKETNWTNENSFYVLLGDSQNHLYEADQLNWEFTERNIDLLLSYFILGKNEELLKNTADIFFLERDIEVEDNFENYKFDFFNIDMKKVFFDKKMVLKNE